MKGALVAPICETARLKSTPAVAKLKVDKIQRTIFAPALSEGAFKSTKTKFNTPKTIAR